MKVKKKKKKSEIVHFNGTSRLMHANVNAVMKPAREKCHGEETFVPSARVHYKVDLQAQWFVPSPHKARLSTPRRPGEAPSSRLGEMRWKVAGWMDSLLFYHFAYSKSGALKLFDALFFKFLEHVIQS